MQFRFCKIIYAEDQVIVVKLDNEFQMAGNELNKNHLEV
jgi:hypothetical protein